MTSADKWQDMALWLSVGLTYLVTLVKDEVPPHDRAANRVAKVLGVYHVVPEGHFRILKVGIMFEFREVSWKGTMITDCLLA